MAIYEISCGTENTCMDVSPAFHCSSIVFSPGFHCLK